MGGLQDQYAPSGYVGLWTRLRDFQRDSLTYELERRRVVQATLMRNTIHLVSARDYWFFVGALRQARRDQFVRVFKIRAAEVEVGAARVRELLAGGPLSRNELVKRLALNNELWYGIGLWVDLVRVPPSGTWERRRADLFLTAEAWLGSVDVDEQACVDRLVRRYLGAFGPARLKDIATWSGLPSTTLSASLARMKIVRYRDEKGAELLDLPGAPLPDPATPAPVRFLPVWDATLLVHARETGVLAEELRPRVFNTKTPHSVGTFMVDGTVAGTWRFEHGRVVTEAFKALAPPVKRAVEEEASRLTDFHV